MIRGFHPIRWIYKCAFYIQLHRLMRYLCRDKIIILMYHGFTDKGLRKAAEDEQGLYLDVKEFRLQMEYLKKYHNVISLDRLIEHYAKGTRPAPNTLAITIDDGYKSSYTLAYPALKEFNVPAAVFLTADFINKKEMLWHDRVEYALSGEESKNTDHREVVAKLKSMPQESMGKVIEDLEERAGRKLSPDGGDTPEIYRPLEWDEVLEMIKSGIISIGSHTCSHVILTRCSPERARREVFLSRQSIEAKTREECRLFCYPNGGVGDFDRRTRELLKQAGYSCGLTAVEGMNDKRSDIFELKRLSVDSREDLIAFVMTLSGISGFLSGVKEAILNMRRRLF